MNPKNEKAKVLVIGLDGATFDNLKPWIKEGKLPNFANILENGVHAPLKSTIPAITFPAWTSLFTGKNPGKHGIFDFIRIGSDYEMPLVSSRDIRSKTIWKTLSEAGHKVCVINVPLTYPPEEVDGYMISGLPAFMLDEESTYPKALWKEVFKEVPGYKIVEEGGFGQVGNLEKMIDEISIVTEGRAKAVKYFIEKDWDFFMVVFFACDVIQHVFWKYMDVTHPDYNLEDAKKYGNVLLRYYQKIDLILGDVLNRIDQNTAVMIVSDHGAGPLYKEVFINKWLIEKNLLKLKEETKARNMLMRIRLEFNRLLPRYASVKKIKKFLPERVKKKFPNPSVNVDWAKTKVYLVTPSGQGLNINQKGLRKNGVVEPGKEYEDLRDSVISGLYELKDPETGGKIIDKVYRREEIYSGPMVKNASDLYVLTTEGYHLQGGSGQGELVGKPEDPYIKTIVMSGIHREHGICMIKGPNIKENTEIEHADITDITPTILHIMDVPIPKDMDGNVLTGAFEESFLVKRPIKYGEVEYERERVRGRVDYLKTLGRI